MKTVMSLAKALKEKNRIAEKIQEHRDQIREYNSIDLGKKRPISIQACLQQLQPLEENLIRVKAAISTANAGVARELNEIMCQRAILMFYQTLDTSEERFVRGKEGEDIKVNKDVVIPLATTLAKSEEIKTKINDLQDKLDEYNALTKVEIDLLDI